MGLMAGHGGGAVVQDNQQKVVLLVHRTGEGRQPGMKEGGVPMKATTFWPVAWEMPAAVLMLEPMQSRKSAMESGGKSPRV